MEKEPQHDSMATVTIKPDYPPSEVYSSEPPPAYHRSQSSTVQVAKITAITVVLVSVILGSFWLASAYVQANASCKQLEQELALLGEAADRFQPPPPLPPQAEALVQNEPEAQKTEDAPKKSKDIDTNSIETSESSDSSSESASNESDDYDDRTPIKFKLPLQLDFDDLAGALIEKNQRSRMNCIVEKKRADEVVDHQPKTLRLPFGLNLTTDPRYEHVSGERMAIFCESGNIQRNAPQQHDDDDDEDGDDSEGETIMIQPVMIPIPQTHFPTHMAQQMPPVPPQQFQQIHPMETMRPPMPPHVQPNQFPPSQILHHIAQQIVAQKIMEAQRAREQQLLQQQQQQQQEPSQEIQQEVTEPRMIPQRYPMMPQSIPLPEEVLTQLNRLPNRDVIVAVSEPDADDNNQEEQQQQPQQQQQQQGVRMIPQLVQQEVRMMPQEVRVVQEQRQSAAEMNGRQSYARGLPVHIPVHMIQQEQQEPQAEATEETRPHYVQPRSLRSVDALLAKNQKRVKRCSCDCAC